MNDLLIVPLIHACAALSEPVWPPSSFLRCERSAVKIQSGHIAGSLQFIAFSGWFSPEEDEIHPEGRGVILDLVRKRGSVAGRTKILFRTNRN